MSLFDLLNSSVTRVFDFSVASSPDLAFKSSRQVCCGQLINDYGNPTSNVNYTKKD